MAGVAVCVPVRDEARMLPGLLAAFEAQAREGAAFTLCLLLDGCADASAAVIAARVPTLPYRARTATLPPAPPSAGRARRAAMALGLEAVGEAGVLLTTDADSRPAPGWIAANLTALAHADVVAGRIVRERRDACAAPLQDRVELYYDRLFALRRRIDPVAWEADATHHWASGASLGFNSHAYRALGGFEDVAAGEDARIVDAAERGGLRVRRDAAVVVETSARRHGRARGGLADHLRALDSGADYPTMAHPADAAWRWSGHARARAAFGGDLSALAERIGRDRGELAGLAAAAPNAQAFAMRAVPDVPGGERLVRLEIAEAALAEIESEMSDVAVAVAVAA